jgi:hypothetical protein
MNLPHNYPKTPTFFQIGFKFEDIFAKEHKSGAISALDAKSALSEILPELYCNIEHDFSGV